MKRITELDAVRGLAAAVVMIYHLKPEAFALAGIRVDLFLVLSGYLVTAIVLDKATVPGFLTTFHLRRYVRILPSYFLAILAIVAVNPLLPKAVPLTGLPYYLTFTQNLPRYWGATPPAFNWYFLHTWSLAVEQQFYLLWPLVVITVGRSRLIPLAVLLAVGSAVARAVGVNWWLLAGRCDGLALGSALAVVMSDLARRPERLGQVRRSLGTCAAVGVWLTVASLGLSPSWKYDDAMTPLLSISVFGFNLFYFGVIGLIACASGHPSLRVLRDKRLIYLGRVSYGLYLYHPLVFAALYLFARKTGLGEPLWLEPIKLAAALVVASLSWHFVEQPVMAWRNRIGYGRANSAPKPHRIAGPVMPQVPA